MNNMDYFDYIIIGAGAAGLMCAVEANKSGGRGLVLDHAEKVAQKIRISGGGRSNFTNLHATPANFLSDNPRFCVSALKRYTQFDFINLVEKHAIPYHERDHGQLFCDGSAQQIIDMLVQEAAGVSIRCSTTISEITKSDDLFTLQSNHGRFTTKSLVIATGGPSIPKMGSSGFAYKIAKQFGLNVIDPRPALVPLTFGVDILNKLEGLQGVSLPATVQVNKTSFTEALLFTHRGLSGPVILQISSYWREGDSITINLLPGTDVYDFLIKDKKSHPKKQTHKVLAPLLAKNLAQRIVDWTDIKGRLGDIPDKTLRRLAEHCNAWKITPSGSEGNRTAEVTLGGVDTRELSSKTMEANAVPGLYFIGEAVDVTGHLGGFNFQWAWSSGWACGQAIQ